MTVKVKNNTKIDVTRLSLGDKLSLVRRKLKNIDFDEPGIHLLGVQPAVGKTYVVNEDLKNRDNFLIVTGSHRLLIEAYARTGVKHWSGFSIKCEKIAKTGKLSDIGVPISTICKMQSCNKKTCEYWTQFKTQKAVAPYHYLPTNKVYNQRKGKKNQFKFDLLVVDESMRKSDEVTFDKNEQIESIEVINKYRPNDALMQSYIHALDWDFHYFDAYLGFNGSELLISQKVAMEKALKDNKLVDAEIIARLNPFQVLKSLYYRTIYPNKNSYPEPVFYHILDLARQGVPIVLLDATFDIKELRGMIAKYEHEEEQISREILLKKVLMPLKDVKLNIYESELKEKGLMIYRMDKENFYYKGAFFFGRDSDVLAVNGQETVRELREFIKKLKRKHPKVGVITYKNLESEFIDLCPTEYFYNLRGSNKIKDVDVLLIIGTPQESSTGIADGYNDLCLTEIGGNKLYRLSYKKIKGKFFPLDKVTGDIKTFPHYSMIRIPEDGLDEKKPNPIIFKNDYDIVLAIIAHFQSLSGDLDLNLYYPVYEFDYNQSESEKYQAIHRARPFLENPPDILVFGDVPEKIKEEFTVKSLDKNETKKFFYDEFIGVYPLVLFEAVRRYYDNTKQTDSIKIAQELRLYKSKDKKKGYNSSFITTILKKFPYHVIRSEVEQIDAAIKNGFQTLAEIRKECGNLKVDDRFIEDCIYYSQNGSFIILLYT